MTRPTRLLWSTLFPVLILAPALASAVYSNIGNIKLNRQRAAEHPSTDGRHDFERALTWNRRNARAYVGLARMHQLQREYSAGDAMLRKAVAIRPREEALHFLLADLLDANGRRGEAVDERIRSRVAPAIMVLAERALGRGDCDEALRYLRGVTTIEPENVKARIKAGACYRMLGQPAQAIAEYQAVLAGHGDAVEAYLGWGDTLYWSSHDIEGARGMYEKALNGRPNDIAPYIQLGELARNERDFAGADAWYARAMSIAPASDVPLRYLGMSALASGRPAEAVKHFRDASAKRPRSAETIVWLGRALLEQGKIEAAIAEFHRGIELQTDSTEAHFWLGHAYERLDLLDKAAEQYREVLAVAENNGYARYALSVIYLTQGLLDQAIAEREKTVRFHPEIGSFHTGLADAYARAGRTQMAVSEYRKGLELQPADTHATQQLETLLKGRP